MKIYFLSSVPCALTLGGVYYGVTDGFERFAEVNPKDRVFAQFIPESALPVGFFLSERLRSSPPDGCEVYLLKDGVAVYAKDFPPADFSLRIVAQQRFGENLVTVFRQGPLQLSLETSEGLFLSTLPPAFADSCRLSYESGLFFLEGKNALAVYTRKGVCALNEKTRSYRVRNDTLYAELPLSDSLGRYAECEWALTEEGCFRTAFRVRQRENGAKDGAKELLPYAFFESVLIGADYAEMLDETLREKAEYIKAFLGDFCGVIPTDDPAVCGLIRKKKERLFEVFYASAEVKDGKIVDVTC